jgi:hypothetical protein
MQSHSTFDSLVGELSSKERKDLLEKIEASFRVSDEPLQVVTEDEEVDLEKSYRLLGFFQRLIISLKRIFQRKERLDAIEEFLLAGIAKNIEKKYPGILHYKTGEILEPFYRELKELQESLSVFIPPLRAALGSDKREFIAFLVSMELPHIHEQIVQASDPFGVSENWLEESDIDVRREIERKMEDIFESISEAERKILYGDMQILQYLSALSAFPYERVLSLFSGHRREKPGTCTLLEIRKSLVELGSLLAGLAFPPRMRLIEGIFLFSVREKMDAESYDLEVDLGRFSRLAEAGIGRIRKFNHAIPLLDLLRLASRNVNYRFSKPGGGEDWFALYRQFWFARFQDQFERFALSRKRSRVTEDAKRFLQVESLPVLEFYRSGLREDAPMFRYELSLSFLAGFLRSVFLKEMHSVLKTILLNGEFYKEQNRNEFADSYNGLAQSLEEMARLDKLLGPGGEIGEAIGQLDKEPIPAPLRRKRLTDQYAKGDTCAAKLLSAAIANLETLCSVIGGILFGEVGGRFDTLANLGYLGRINGQNVMVSLGLVHKRLEHALLILRELYDTETSMS